MLTEKQQKAAENAINLFVTTPATMEYLDKKVI